MNMYGAGPGASPQAGMPGGELRLSFEGRDITVQPGQTVRIGRSPDNDLVTNAPTVSRQHAVLRWGGSGWEFENLGAAGTVADGQPVNRIAVDRPLTLTLGGPGGPVLRAEPAPAPAPIPAPQAAAYGAPDYGAGLSGAGLSGAGLSGAGPAGAAPQAGPGAPPAGYPPTAYQPQDNQPPGYPQPGYPPPAYDTSGYLQQPGFAQPGPPQGYQQPGYGQPGYPPPGYQQPGYQPGYQQPGAPGGWVPGPGGPRPPGLPGAPLSGDDMAMALKILFPIQSWIHNAGWRQGLRLLTIFYALLPLIFLATLSSSSRLSTPGWAYSLYIAPLWIMGFWMLIRPGRVGLPVIQAAVGIIIWTLAWMNIVTINVNDSLHITDKIGFFPALVIGFNEEITKALPVLLAGLILMRFRSTKLSVAMTMFLGTIAGLTFGVFEQAFYTSADIVGIAQAQSASEAVNAALAFAERIFVDGFQHAVWAGISGFFIGMALNYPRRRIQLIIIGVATPAILHALNDFMAGDSIWLVIVVQAASLLLFIGYTMSAVAIEQRVKETPLFRGDSMLVQAYNPNAGPPGA